MAAHRESEACEAKPKTNENDHGDSDAGPERRRRQPLVFGRRRDRERPKTGKEADEKGQPYEEEEQRGSGGGVRGRFVSPEICGRVGFLCAPPPADPEETPHPHDRCGG